MSYFKRDSKASAEPRASRGTSKEKFYKQKKWKIAMLAVAICVVIGGVFLWRTESVLKKITNGGLLSSLSHALPGVNNDLKGEKDGRINILLLAMRGADDPAGGTLADTIMVASIVPKENKMSLISLPRDLYVDNPATGSKTKLNAVHAYGEQKGAGQGMTYMEQKISDIAGIPISYSVVINFHGFNQLLTTIGGVDITLDKPFEESAQFNQPHVCDGVVFTTPTGKFETKTKRNKKTGLLRITAQYPLCYNAHPECSGDFKLPAGKQSLNAEQALCYARSRETSNDFERAKRQQQVIQAVKDKLLSVGTLTDFSKLNGILNSLGDNVKTDMQAWEMKRMYDLYSDMKNAQLYQRVLDTTDDPETGLLYGVQDPGAGDILLPKGDNYDKIQSLFKNIFTLAPQKK